jgi:hypothetical protein
VETPAGALLNVFWRFAISKRKIKQDCQSCSCCVMVKVDGFMVREHGSHYIIRR